MHLAELNVARLKEPIDSPATAAFVAALEPVNALADAAPGFVWRLQTDAGDATSIRAFDDDLVIVNLSVWESLESLRSFVFRSDHREVLRRRRDWFEPWDGPHLVLFWVEEGMHPTLAEALDRLAQLGARGPQPDAFSLRHPFAADGSPAMRAEGSAGAGTAATPRSLS
jgi:heme-degrading monooxygenase HmoA